MKYFILVLLFSLASFNTNAEDVDFNATMSGGAFFNEKLKRTAGREYQLKMTEVVLSASGEVDRWRWKAELVGLGDEMYVDDNDSAYNDIYTNLGTSLTYYGDHPVREAWVATDVYSAEIKFGRMFSALSDQDLYYFAPYTPHSTILQHGLYNGLRVSTGSSWKSSVSLLWGRDRPCFDGVCYLDGSLDVNEKGNNTPVIQLASSYANDWLGLGAAASYTKVGSAPGGFRTGKHNDTRAKVFGEVILYKSEDWLIDLYGQYSYFLMGLTTDGEQGERTPVKSYDITKQGWFVSPSVTYDQFSVRYTYEQLDRANALAFRDVANFDPSDPVMSDTEKRHIVSGFWRNNTLEIGLHYTTEQVSYIYGGDEWGMTFKLEL